MRVNLLSHNGVFGANPVAAFAGATIEGSELTPADTFDYEGRSFTFAYREKDAEGVDIFNFREHKLGEPSDWAKAREAERSSRG